MGLFKPFPEKAYQNGISSLKARNYMTAIENLQIVTETENRLTSNAHYHLGICYLQIKEYGQSAKHYFFPD